MERDSWWKILPGVLTLIILFSVGYLVAAHVSSKAATTETLTFTRNGRVVKVRGAIREVRLPRQTVTRGGVVVTLPARTIAITDTRIGPGQTRIVTRRGTVTITGPGGTTTLPGTTITQTLPGTTITSTETVPVTSTITVTAPGTTETETVTVTS